MMIHWDAKARKVRDYWAAILNVQIVQSARKKRQAQPRIRVYVTGVELSW